MNYKLLKIACIISICGTNFAQSQDINSRLLQAVTIWVSWADNAVNQNPRPADAEYEVAKQVQGNVVLRDHNARMTFLPLNSPARFKLTLEGLSIQECRTFIAVGARDPVNFPIIELNGEPMPDHSTTRCADNSSVALLRL